MKLSAWLLLLPLLIGGCLARAPHTAFPPPMAATATAVAPQSVPARTGDGSRAWEVTIWAPFVGALEEETLRANVDLIAEVNPVSYELGANGKINGRGPDSRGLATARAVGLRVVPSIANSGFSRNIVMTAIGTDEARRRHVADILALVETNGYDGIDIDYESLSAEDRELFTEFVEDLAAALHAQGKQLSIAVHPKTDDAGTWGGPAAQDWPRLGAAADRFKIMTYDYHWSTSEAGPIAPVEWVDEVLSYAATVVPPEKTYVGLPFYGYDWVGEAGQGLEWREAVALAERTAAEVRRDASNEAWFTYDDGRHTVYFADALTACTKVATIWQRHPRLAGIAIWRLGGEDPGNWPALRAVLGTAAGGQPVGVYDSHDSICKP